MDGRHIQFCVHESFDQGNSDQDNVDQGNFEQSSCPKQLDLQELQALFQVTAFWAKDRRLDDWAIALSHSKPIVSAWDSYGGTSSQDRLIGFARATSDGVYRATIWDVVIHPDYQGAGLGRKLVETVLTHPHVNRVERVYLMTTHQQSFYQRIGFEQNSTTTMVLYNQHFPDPCPTLAVEMSQ